MFPSHDLIEEAKKIIIEGIANGKSLMSILAESDDTPGRTTVYTWFNEKHDDYDAQFLNDYTRAREASADLNAEQIEEIADKVLEGKYDANAARVAIDAKKWSAGIKQPKKYGKVERHKHEGTIGNVNIEVSDDEAAEIIKKFKEDY